MPKTGGYLEPIIFATASAAIGAFIHLLFAPRTDEVRKLISAVPMVAVIIPFITLLLFLSMLQYFILFIKRLEERELMKAL